MSNITLEETIENIIQNLFLTTDKVHNFDRDGIIQFLRLAVYDSLFTFDEKYYTQIDGVAIRPQLGPTLHNAYLSRLEKKWPSECIVEVLLNLCK